MQNPYKNSSSAWNSRLRSGSMLRRVYGFSKFGNVSMKAIFKWSTFSISLLDVAKICRLKYENAKSYSTHNTLARTAVLEWKLLFSLLGEKTGVFRQNVDRYYNRLHLRPNRQFCLANFGQNSEIGSKRLKSAKSAENRPKSDNFTSKY